MEKDDKNQVQYHIDYACCQKDKERTSAVSMAPENGGAEIINQEEGISQEVKFQVYRCQMENGGRCIDEPEQVVCHKEPCYHAKDPRQESQAEGRMDGQGNAAFIFSADGIGNKHIAADGKASGQADEESNEFSVDTHSGQGIGVSKAAHHGSVCSVEELLDHAGKGNGDSKGNDIPDQWSFCHSYGFHGSIPPVWGI